MCAAILAMAVGGAACASTGATPHPFPMPADGGVAAAPSQPIVTAPLSAIVQTALGLRGTPYRNGGSDPRGFDCSGFTQYVFAQHGIVLPREVRDQFETGRSVKASQVEAGDLVFFITSGSHVSHVAIAIDSERFVHAPSSTGVVRVERLDSSYWAPKLKGVRRVG